MKAVSSINLEDDEVLLTCWPGVPPFPPLGSNLQLVVGTTTDMHVSPRSCSSLFMSKYKFMDEGWASEFQLKGRTAFGGAFGGRTNLFGTCRLKFMHRWLYQHPGEDSC